MQRKSGQRRALAPAGWLTRWPTAALRASFLSVWPPSVFFGCAQPCFYANVYLRTQPSADRHARERVDRSQRAVAKRPQALPSRRQLPRCHPFLSRSPDEISSVCCPRLQAQPSLMAWRRRDRRSPVMSDMSLASSAFGVTIARSALSIDRLSQSCSVFMAERWPASREAPRFLAEARHLGSLDGRPNRRGSADPITHRCRELAGGSARLRSARVVPFQASTQCLLFRR